MTRNHKFILFIFIYILSAPFFVYSRDFGKEANSFPVKEEGFITMIHRKLQTIDLEKENLKMQEKAREAVENPRAVDGVLPATRNREFFHDPSYVLDSDVVLPCGKVLYKEGTRVNPLDHMDLSRRLFFIDGRDERQIQWLEGVLKGLDKESSDGVVDVIILVAGSVFKMQERLDRVVYFDQNGSLTRKFGIKASPALLLQEEKALKIREFYLGDGK